MQQVSVSGQLTAIAAQIRALPIDDAHAVSAAERGEYLAALQRVVDAAHAQMLPVVAASDVAGDGELLVGARSTVAWLKQSLRWSGRDAAGVVRAARGYRDGLLSDSADELVEGRMSLQHVREIGRAVGALPAPAQEPAAQILTEAAKSLAVDDLGRLGRQVRHMVDPDGAMARYDDNLPSPSAAHVRAARRHGRARRPPGCRGSCHVECCAGAVSGAHERRRENDPATAG